MRCIFTHGMSLFPIGIQYTASIEDYPKDKWDMMIGITMTAPYMLMKEFIPDMKNKGNY